MEQNPGFRRFVSLTELDEPRLLARMTKDELGIDAQRYGITSRLLARPEATVPALAESVLDKLCSVNGVRLSELAAVVLSTRQFEVEDLADQVARRLDSGIDVFGIERACSGFPAATKWGVELTMARQAPVAIVTAEIISRNINWEHPEGTPDDQQRARGQASKLFADGVAAVIIEPPGGSNAHEILDAWSDEVPDEHQLLQKAEVVGAKDPWGQEVSGPSTCISMPGKRGWILLKTAPALMVESLETSVENARSAGSLHEQPIAHIVHHQANGMMVPRMEKHLAATEWGEKARVWDCIGRHGNTVSATIPLAMADIQDQIDAGTLVGMPTVGAGGPGYRPDVLSTGCVLVRTAASTA